VVEFKNCQSFKMTVIYWDACTFWGSKINFYLRCMNVNTIDIWKIANNMYLKSLFCTCKQFLHFAYFKNTSVFHVVLPGYLDASWKLSWDLRSLLFTHFVSSVTNTLIVCRFRLHCWQLNYITHSSWCQYTLQFIYAKLLLFRIWTTFLVTDNWFAGYLTTSCQEGT